MGSATRSVRSGRLCLSDDPGRDRKHLGRLSSGDGPRLQTGATKMSLADAHAFAFSLAATLMVTIIIYAPATAP